MTTVIISQLSAVRQIAKYKSSEVQYSRDLCSKCYCSESVLERTFFLKVSNLIGIKDEEN